MPLPPRRAPCTLNTSVTHVECANLTREASAQLPSVPCTLSAIHAQLMRDSHQVRQPHTRSQRPAALGANAAVAAPSAMHAQHERDSCRARQPHTRSRHPAALSTAA
eukprot:4401662-Prymnesium_polylepis.1